MCATYTFSLSSDVAVYKQACSEVSKCIEAGRGVCTLPANQPTTSGSGGTVSSKIILYATHYDTVQSKNTCENGLNGTWVAY
jgi:hypothetical protein